MNKKQMVEALYKDQRKRGFSKAALHDFLDSMLDQMTYLLKRHKKISHPEIGVFKVEKKQSRAVRNPKTGERMQTNEGLRIRFKPAVSVKRRLNSK